MYEKEKKKGKQKGKQKAKPSSSNEGKQITNLQRNFV